MNKLGEIVFESFPNQILNKENVNTENFPAGVYHLILNGDQVRTHNKFVVLKN
jgi:hypothetical protein